MVPVQTEKGEGLYGTYIDLKKYGFNARNTDTLIFWNNAPFDIMFKLGPKFGRLGPGGYRVFLDKGPKHINYIARRTDSGSMDKKVSFERKTVYPWKNQTFWLTWKDGRIATGEGDDPSGKALLEWTDPNPIPINAIGISSTCKAWTMKILNA